MLWKRTGATPEDRHVLLEGTEAAAFADCAAPEVRILLANPGRASLFPQAVIGSKADWEEGSILGTGESTSQSLDLPAGSWNLSLQYFSPFDLTLSAPGLPRAAGGGARRPAPEHDQPRQQRPVLAGGALREQGRRGRFTVTTAEASALQSLSGYDGKAYVGELVAVPAEPHRIVPLGAACDSWIDWYESPLRPDPPVRRLWRQCAREKPAPRPRPDRSSRGRR